LAFFGAECTLVLLILFLFCNVHVVICNALMFYNIVFNLWKIKKHRIDRSSTSIKTFLWVWWLWNRFRVGEAKLIMWNFATISMFKSVITFYPFFLAYILKKNYVFSIILAILIILLFFFIFILFLCVKHLENHKRKCKM
jgi:hypothetical protein